MYAPLLCLFRIGGQDKTGPSYESPMLMVIFLNASKRARMFNKCHPSTP